ncbi:MAG: hypothetical protein V3V05_06605 [Pontiella sp.]
MSLVKHIFKKDLRRLRVFLYFWLPVTLLSAIASSIQPPADDFALQATLQVGAMLASILQFIMMALMVPLLMQSEPLVGTTAFWLTRPLDKGDVMKAKLLFAGIVLVLTPVLIQLIMLIANQIPLAYVAPAILDHVISYTGTLLLLMAIASITRNFGFFALTVGAYLAAGLIIGVLLMIRGQFALFEGGGPSVALTDSRTLLSSIVAIAMLSSIVFIQYRHRKTRWAYSLLTLEFLITLWIGAFSQITLFKTPAGSLTAATMDPIEIRVNDVSSSVSDSFSMRRQKEKSKEVRGEFLFENLPPFAFARISEINSTLRVGDHEVGEPTRENAFSSRGLARQALSEALAPLEPIYSDNMYYNSTTILKLKESDYQATRGEQGIYTADVTANLFRYEKRAALPIQVGERFKEGAFQATIASVLRATEGCSIVVSTKTVSAMFKRDRSPKAGERWIYLLANERTGEVYLPDRDNNRGISMNTSGAGLQSQNKILRFSSIDKLGEINAAWLDEATLLILETQWMGEIQKNLIDDQFSISGSSSSFSAMIPNTSAKDNIERLAAIELPEQPSRADVKAYIQKIQTISATQSNRGSKDPQIGMLTDLGPEYLDLLIGACDEHDYYLKQAIQKLATEEHKELILTNLRNLPSLSKSVIKFDWQEDARETLLNGLKRETSLPSEWLLAVASFQAPETYPLLTNFLIRGGNRDDTYEAIKNLPGISLNEAVSKAWKHAKYDNEWERRAIIPIALQFGHIDALDAATLELTDAGASSYSKTRFRKSINIHAGVSGSDIDLRTWFLANKPWLRFDHETKRFISSNTNVNAKIPTIKILSAEDIEFLSQPVVLPIPGTEYKDTLDDFSNITLPNNPSRDEVKVYLHKVHDISAAQSIYSPRDPQVDMMLKVGPEHLDLLIQQAKKHSSRYEVTVIRKLLNPEHKELLLSNLRDVPDLAQSVVKFGWEKDAQHILLYELKHETSLPPSWIKAVASLQDPETYPLLTNYFINGKNQGKTYRAIKNLPGIDQSESFPRAWEKAKRNPGYERRQMMAPAVEFGMDDSLGFIIQALFESSLSASSEKIYHAVFEKHTGISGSAEELQQWYQANKDQLRFDPETKLFVAEGGG